MENDHFFSSRCPPNFWQIAGVGVVKDVEAFGVSLHQSVLDSVVDHLHEVSGARWPAIDIAILGSAGNFFASRRARDLGPSGRQSLENRIEMLHSFPGAANHHAITTFQSPHA